MMLLQFYYDEDKILDVQSHYELVYFDGLECKAQGKLVCSQVRVSQVRVFQNCSFSSN